ncbi:MAG: nitrilase-related carbon-nitrogen hydrolase, partial [Bacteroidota bacterium]
MRLALVQQPATGDLAGNLARGLDAFDRAADAGADLVAYAELAFSPFYPQRHATPEALAQAEPIPGPTTEAFQQRAADRGVVVVLNLFERAGDQTFDTSPVIDADGALLGRTRMVHIT